MQVIAISRFISNFRRLAVWKKAQGGLKEALPEDQKDAEEWMATEPSRMTSVHEPAKARYLQTKRHQ
jgi:hypothetical protein